MMDIEKLAREAMKAFHGGHDPCHGEPWPKEDRVARKWEAVASVVATLVAEEAAKVCEERAGGWASMEAEIEAFGCAAAIRERFKAS